MLTAAKARALSTKLGRERFKAAAKIRQEVERRAKADEPKVAQGLVDVAMVRIENATTEGNFKASIEVPNRSENLVPDRKEGEHASSQRD